VSVDRLSSSGGGWRLVRLSARVGGGA
jgi:hypothetical protein